jgi:hypothetical protein
MKLSLFFWAMIEKVKYSPQDAEKGSAIPEEFSVSLYLKVEVAQDSI